MLGFGASLGLVGLLALTTSAAGAEIGAVGALEVSETRAGAGLEPGMVGGRLGLATMILISPSSFFNT